MTQYGEFNQTILEICDAEKKDLQDEVRHLKEVIKVKNQEIGILKYRLRSSETEMSELQNFLMSQVSALTAKLTNTIPALLNPTPRMTMSSLSSPKARMLSKRLFLQQLLFPVFPNPQPRPPGLTPLQR